MSKSGKSARHSDDKNYQRKLTNAPPKVIFDGNLKEIHNPSFLATGTTKQSNAPVLRKFKSKLRSPTKPKTVHTLSTTSQANHSQTTSNKSVDKRLSLAPLSNSKNHGPMKVHEDSGEIMMVHHTKALRKDMKQHRIIKVDDNVDKEKESKTENVVESIPAVTSNGKSSETVSTQPETVQSPLVTIETVVSECVSNDGDTQDVNIANNKSNQIVSDENDTNGHKQDTPTEEKLAENAEEWVSNVISNSVERENVEDENKDDNKEKEEKQPIALTIENSEVVKLQHDENASGSDLVGSTTSESSPVKDVESQINKEDNNTQAKETDDVSFISYDSNIMLKDVQIKLNDCLKDNSKMLDVTDPNATMSESLKDLSFGRTLRSISGRDSLRRMKHITVRERLLTPNDSLFVNTSGTSFLHDQSRYTELNADSPSHNSNHYARKRKLDEDMNESVKRRKSDESYGLFNTSLEYIWNLRKPIQISTPKTQGYKFHVDEKKTNDGDHETIAEESTEPKKWCIVM